jgi:CarboxypepD_reg-like domain
MRKIASYMIALVLANILTIAAFAQSNTISGKVLNRVTNESVSAVSVAIKGSQVGTFTDDKGNFKFSFNQKLPVTLMVSSVGYAVQEVVVNDVSQPLTIQLVSSNSLGQEVVVSATRVPQSIMESPVSIERVSASNIRLTAVVIQGSISW